MPGAERGRGAPAKRLRALKHSRAATPASRTQPTCLPPSPSRPRDLHTTPAARSRVLRGGEARAQLGPRGIPAAGVPRGAVLGHYHAHKWVAPRRLAWGACRHSQGLPRGHSTLGACSPASRARGAGMRLRGPQHPPGPGSQRPPTPLRCCPAAVGYGDYSPSWWLTQSVVICMLLVAFTLLPMMSGRVVDALNQATKYQRGRWARGPREGRGGRGKDQWLIAQMRVRA